MAWHGSLALRYRREGARTVGHDRHDGPLRVLKALYPEGDAICHHVLVHPPGGIAGGDTLALAADVGEDAHALITSAGAARFYRSTGAPATQDATLAVAARARLEWLPLETIAFSGCRAANRLRFSLAPGATMLGWDLVALGLPASADGAFARGAIELGVQWPGVWHERGVIAADDLRLLDGPVGLGGRRALLTLWCAAHDGWPDALRDGLLDAARDAFAAHGLQAWAGASAPERRLVVARAVAHRIEPLFALAVAVRAAWRGLAWGLDGAPPRVWRT